MGRARRNEEDGPPAGYSYMGFMDLDENYEIAMSEDGVMAYKIIGRVTEWNSPKNERMWADVRAQGRSRLTHADVAKYFTLPEDFYPEATLVGVGYDGKGYNVYFLNEEDVAARTVARRLASAADAEYLARHTLNDAKKPRMAARIIDRKAMGLQYGHLKKNRSASRSGSPTGSTMRAALVPFSPVLQVFDAMRERHPSPHPQAAALRNMAGRPGRLGLPRYEGPRPEGYAKFGKKDLRDMASSGDQLAAMELEWRKQDKALRSGMVVPERVAKRPAQPPQVTAFAPGFSAVPAVSDRGQQVFRILLHGRPIPTEKMPEGRFSLSMEGAAAMSHKLDPQTGERLRFGKTKSQRRGSKAAANPRTWRGAQSKKTRAGKLTKRQRKIKRDWKAAGRTASSLFPQSAGYSTWPKGSVVTEPRYPAASYVGYVPKKAPWKKTRADYSPEQARKIRQRRKARYKREATVGKGSHRGMLRAYSDLRHALGAKIEPEWLEEQFPPVSEAMHWPKHDLREAAQELWDLAEEKGAVIPESVDAIANPLR